MGILSSFLVTLNFKKLPAKGLNLLAQSRKNPVGPVIVAELAEFKEGFDLFDRDQDGVITMAELGARMKEMGENPTKEDLQSTINEVDADRSGTINFSEFLTLLSRKMGETDTHEEIKEAFRLYDTDGNGFISKKELFDFFSKMGDQFHHPEDAGKIIYESDVDGDGQLDFEEYLQKMGFDMGGGPGKAKAKRSM
eukprot:Skav200881  [mRNA]  locus=scaffold4880:186506:187090:+ [translate_table: standard]